MIRSRLTRKGPRIGGNGWLLLVILAILGVSIWVMTPSGTSVLHREKDNLGLRLGLDLQGGTHVVYQGVFSENVSDAEKSFDTDAAINSIRRRVDSFGVVEPVIRKLGGDSIDIQLPGIGVEDALALVEKTAYLEFREIEMNGSNPVTLGDYLSGNRTSFFETRDSGVEGKVNRIFASQASGGTQTPVAFLEVRDGALVYLDVDGNPIDPATLQASSGAYSWMPGVGEITINGVSTKVVLTGKYLTKALPDYPSQDNPAAEISVGIEWNANGTQLFNEIAQRIKAKAALDTPQRSLGIFLDNELIMSPQVFPSTMTESTYGSGASITGNFTAGEARLLAVELTSGALPMPLKIIYQPTQVSPTLGVEFAHRAYLAGLAGFLVVALFMILYYRLPGVLSALALVIYAVIVLAVYKAIPVTLTLAGVAGFIVSLGMAVDANVLIFERMKEELRAGRTLKAAIETGFNRAWPAIRDSNITTWIACGILYWFGSSIPSATIVMGFALTLAIGVAVSMFSAITVTRTFLLLFTGSWATKRVAWFGVEAKSAVETRDV
jgi:preprotein translocase subunit SecD